MSWCSEWVHDWLRKSGRTQADLAGVGGVDRANVSRWQSGQSKPDREIIANLINELPVAEATGLLVAWLKDSVPEGGAGLVQIVAAEAEASQTMVREDFQRAGQRLFPAGMSADLQERLLFFGHLAVGNPDIRRILDLCYQLARRGEADSANLPPQ